MKKQEMTRYEKMTRYESATEYFEQCMNIRKKQNADKDKRGASYAMML